MAAHESQRTHAHETIRRWVAERDGRQETSGGERSHFNPKMKKNAAARYAMSRIAPTQVALVPIYRKDEERDAASGGLIWLSVIAVVSPLLGLLGTIMGLIQAFTAVANANPAEKADLLSASISVAVGEGSPCCRKRRAALSWGAQTRKILSSAGTRLPARVSTPAPASGAHRIVVSCEQECWIEVKDGLERQLVSSLNPAGTERVVRGRAPFELVIGNAQHVRVTYDGRPIDLQPHTRVEVARFTLQ